MAATMTWLLKGKRGCHGYLERLLDEEMWEELRYYKFKVSICSYMYCNVFMK